MGKAEDKVTVSVSRSAQCGGNREASFANCRVHGGNEGAPASVVEGLAFGPMGVTAAGMDRNRDGKLSWDEVMWSVRAKATLTSELVRVRLVEIPDSWFTWLDQDWDDVLSESEIANSTTRLAQLFSASDSDLAPESLPVQLDVLVTRAYGDEDPFGSEVFVRSTAPSPESKPLPEWFQAMDTNGDGLVTRREFLGGDESLKSWIAIEMGGWTSTIFSSGLSFSGESFQAERILQGFRTVCQGIGCVLSKLVLSNRRPKSVGERRTR